MSNNIFSPDGKKAAVSFNMVDEDAQSVSMIAFYDLSTKKTVFFKKNQEDGFFFAQDISFSPDSKSLAILSSVLTRAALVPRVEIINVEDGKKITEFK